MGIPVGVLRLGYSIATALILPFQEAADQEDGLARNPNCGLGDRSNVWSGGGEGNFNPEQQTVVFRRFGWLGPLQKRC